MGDEGRYFYRRQAGRLFSVMPASLAEVSIFARLARETDANAEAFWASSADTLRGGAGSLLATARHVRVARIPAGGPSWTSAAPIPLDEIIAHSRSIYLKKVLDAQ